MKSRESVITNGRAVFYASMWGDLRSMALDCGWALALHGSLNSDMDIMAMAWTDDADDVMVMLNKLHDCFTTPEGFKREIKRYDQKPNNRVVYTINIFADFYLDINVIEYKKTY